MAYNPHTQYRGDMYLYQAITNLGEKAGEALTNYRKDRAESQFLEEQMQGLMDSARQQANLIRLDDPQVVKALEDEVTDLGKFGGMSLAQKRGKVAALNFQLNQLMKVGESQRANRYLGLQEENVALGRRREEREIARETAQRQAGQRFLSALDQPKSVPAQWRSDVSVSPLVQPQGQEKTLDDILAAGAGAGGDLDPNILLKMMEQFDPVKRAQALAYTRQVDIQNRRLEQGPDGQRPYRELIRTDPRTNEVTERMRFPMTDQEVAEAKAGLGQPAATPKVGTVDPLTEVDTLREVVRQLMVRKAAKETKGTVSAEGEVRGASARRWDIDIDELIRKYAARLAEAERLAALQAGGMPSFQPPATAAAAVTNAPNAMAAQGFLQPGQTRTNAAGIKLTRMPGP